MLTKKKVIYLYLLIKVSRVSCCSSEARLLIQIQTLFITRGLPYRNENSLIWTEAKCYTSYFLTPSQVNFIYLAQLKQINSYQGAYITSKGVKIALIQAAGATFYLFLSFFADDCEVSDFSEGSSRLCGPDHRARLPSELGSGRTDAILQEIKIKSQHIVSYVLLNVGNLGKWRAFIMNT